METNLKNIRKSLGLTQQHVADSLGITFESYNKLENGKRQLRADRMEQLARIFNVPIEALLAGPHVIPVTVKGFVEAGVWQEHPQWPEDEWYMVTIPFSNKLKSRTLIGAEIRGHSMNLVYPEGSIVIFEPVGRKDALETGKRYIVERRLSSGEYEQTAKTLIKDPTGAFWLKPESDHPEFFQPIPIQGSDGDEVVIRGKIVFALVAET